MFSQMLSFDTQPKVSDDFKGNIFLKFTEYYKESFKLIP